MNKIFINNYNLLNKNENVFDYDMYMSACEAISNDIKSKYNFKNKKIGLLGIARGGLPLLTTVSQFLGIRHISFIQCKMTNSDTLHDYGEFSIISEYLEPGIEEFILFDDILYKGKTTNGVIKHLREKNINVKNVYTLVADEKFKNITPNGINYNSGYECKADSWVHFFWVDNIKKLSIGENSYEQK